MLLDPNEAPEAGGTLYTVASATASVAWLRILNPSAMTNYPYSWKYHSQTDYWSLLNTLKRLLDFAPQGGDISRTEKSISNLPNSLFAHS